MSARQTWPFAVRIAGMAIFGLAAAALHVGTAAMFILAVIAAALATGRP